MIKRTVALALILLIFLSAAISLPVRAAELPEPDENTIYVNLATGDRIYYDPAFDAYYIVDEDTGERLYYDPEQNVFYQIDESTGERIGQNDNSDETIPEPAYSADLADQYYRVLILEILEDEWFRKGFMSEQIYNYDFAEKSFYYVNHDTNQWIYVDLLGAKYDNDTGATYYRDPKTKEYYTIGEMGQRSYIVLPKSADDFTYMDSHIQILLCRVLNGPHKGEVIHVTYDISDVMQNDQPDYPAKVGETFMAGYFETDRYGNVSAVIVSQKRETGIIWLGIIFILFLVFLGGLRSLRSVIALLLTLAGCIFVVVPLISKGYDPVWVAVLFAIAVIVATLTIVYGFSAKTLAATLGAASGLLVSGILAGIMTAFLKMIGLVDGEAMSLAQVRINGMPISLSGVLFASIIISVLGGTIDVGVSIASALEELHQKAPELPGADLMKSGINIGVDIMQASLFTMITAFVGSTMHILLLLYINNMNTEMIINSEMMMSELLRALVGSIGLLFTVPITSFIAGLISAKGKFGRLSPDCFASVVTVRRLIAKFQEKKQSVLAGMRKSEAVDIPENLYEIAQRNKKAREDSDTKMQ